MDVFVLFTQSEHLEAFQCYLNCHHAKMSFTIEKKSKTACPFSMYKLFMKIENWPQLTIVYKLGPFLHVQIIHENRELTTTYHNLPPSTNCVIDNLKYALTKLKTELLFLKQVSERKMSTWAFLIKCFKKCTDKTYKVNGTTLTFKKFLLS